MNRQARAAAAVGNHQARGRQREDLGPHSSPITQSAYSPRSVRRRQKPPARPGRPARRPYPRRRPQPPCRHCSTSRQTQRLAMPAPSAAACRAAAAKQTAEHAAQDARRAPPRRAHAPARRAAVISGNSTGPKEFAAEEFAGPVGDVQTSQTGRRPPPATAAARQGWRRSCTSDCCAYFWLRLSDR